MMFWYGDHMSGWGWVLGGIGMVAFWGLIITGIVLFIRSSGSGTQPPNQQSAPPTPEQLLAARFARGEIDETEYTGRLAALRGQLRS